MSDQQILSAIDVGLVLALLFLPTLAVLLFPHPSQLEAGGFRAFMRFIGRLALLRHRMAPGTVHIPGPLQPWWTQAELERLMGSAKLAQLQELQREPTQPLKRIAPEDVALPRESGVQRRVAAPTVYWLQPMGVALLLVLAGCSGTLARPRMATGAALKEAGGRAADLSQFSAVEEQAIVDSAKTQEEARARLAAHRKAVDFCKEKVLLPSTQALKDIGAALAPPPKQPAAGGGAP